jgi:hypothetical protein
MWELGVHHGGWRRSWRVCVLSLIPVVLGATPVRAQDFFGLFRLLFSPPPGGPVYRPYEYRRPPEFERRYIPRRLARADEPSTKPPIKPRPLGEVSNPVPELLADRTLRRGDMVMFPDGLRVFAGRPGAQHSMADFVPAARSLDGAHPSTRRLIANIRPGWNGAWAEKKTASGALAAKSLDVDATGAVSGARR